MTREPVRNNCCCILINHVRQQTSHYINNCLINSDFYNFNSWNQSQKTTTRRLQVIKLLSGRCALRCSDANNSLSTSQWVKNCVFVVFVLECWLTCTLDSGRLIFKATSSLMKISGYRVLPNRFSSTSSWARVNVVLSLLCLRGVPDQKRTK